MGGSTPGAMADDFFSSSAQKPDSYKYTPVITPFDTLSSVTLPISYEPDYPNPPPNSTSNSARQGHHAFQGEMRLWQGYSDFITT